MLYACCMLTGAAPHASRAVDPRPARTRAAIYGALDRLGTRGEHLTVAAVVAEAQVSRSSFYAQFQDLDDVAVQLMSELFADIQRMDANMRRGEGARDATSACLKRFFTECQSRPGLYGAALNGDLSSEARHRIYEILARSVTATAGFSAPRSVDPQIAATFIAAGLLAVVTEWLRCRQPTTEEHLRAQLMSLLPGWVVDPPEPTGNLDA